MDRLRLALAVLLLAIEMFVTLLFGLFVGIGRSYVHSVEGESTPVWEGIVIAMFCLIVLSILALTAWALVPGRVRRRVHPLLLLWTAPGLHGLAALWLFLNDGINGFSLA